MLVKASSAYAPNFKSVPSFSTCVPVDHCFPVNSAKCSTAFKQWFSTYFNAEKYMPRPCSYPRWKPSLLSLY